MYNKLDENIRKEPNLKKFKHILSAWIKQNIAVKPTVQYSNIVQRFPKDSSHVSPHCSGDPSPNLITNYFKPI